MTTSQFCVKIRDVEVNLMNKRIYLDNAATTPVDPAVFEAIKPYFGEKFGNASSLHQFGQDAQQGVVVARQNVADFLGCEPKEIIFNSGATEGNNTIIKGFGLSKKLAGQFGGQAELGQSRAERGGKIHIITTAIEHECVLEPVKFLVKEGYIEATFLPVNREGIVSAQEVEKAIKPNTVLVSVMYANNEVGTIQPIAEIGQLLKKINQSRANKIYFHTDAAQAANYLDCKVDNLGVDFLTLSAHKFYGPKGIGVLYIRPGSFLTKYFHGGEQEFRMRAGTHNTPGIVGLGAAIEKIKNQKSKIKIIEDLRNKLIDGVLKNIQGSALNGSREHRLPNNANFRFERAEGEAILIALDLEGIAVSTGSACASKSLEPSHVLMAMGFEFLEAHSAVRFSLGRFTEEKDIDKVLSVLPKIVERLRGITGGAAERKEKLLKDLGC
ncbi:MAG: Cysteine desulfurase [Parcubacteria group bacterium GW2011_GWA2_43_9b]|nr:MAG: Cysteine desulfurase [Parcubacteria group bacterium GW2011_GWA2_43_9b]